MVALFEIIIFHVNSTAEENSRGPWTTDITTSRTRSRLLYVINEIAHAQNKGRRYKLFVRYCRTTTVISIENLLDNVMCMQKLFVVLFLISVTFYIEKNYERY